MLTNLRANYSLTHVSSSAPPADHAGPRELGDNLARRPKPDEAVPQQHTGDSCRSGIASPFATLLIEERGCRSRHDDGVGRLQLFDNVRDCLSGAGRGKDRHRRKGGVDDADCFVADYRAEVCLL